MNARTWIDQLSTAGRKEPARATAAAAQPLTTVVERWNGKGWTEHLLVWNGTSYVEPHGAEPEQCDCYFDGDRADASECRIHGRNAA